MNITSFSSGVKSLQYVFFDKISGLWTDLILYFKINSDYL